MVYHSRSRSALLMWGSSLAQMNDGQEASTPLLPTQHAANADEWLFS
jgi:hypothetical protein